MKTNVSQQFGDVISDFSFISRGVWGAHKLEYYYNGNAGIVGIHHQINYAA
jgi:hypothetical protein